ncbi:AAA domain-containing protein, putative AbiEii toxin, Type IV TA system [Micromonospora zamorensis]|nr:AAA domain-containing protein, putative AbiEii toxin, Type IV TA system [Micromonospora zamorensis]
MARLVGPDDAYRVVYLPDGRARARGIPVPLFADPDCTIAADVQTTAGADIPESTVLVDVDSRIPLFLFPDGADVYTSINGGPTVALYARLNDRIGAGSADAAQRSANLADLANTAAARAVSLGALGLLDSAARRTPVGRMSQGQQRRLDLALALAGRPTLILLDEPTNHLSSALADELTAAIRDTGAAVVVATHDRQLLRDLADWPRLRVGDSPTPGARTRTTDREQEHLPG